jgi:hypothetical protein
VRTVCNSNRPVLPGLALVACLAALAGCAPPLHLNTPHETAQAAARSLDDPVAAVSDSITVQVRYFPYSPTVSVVAWMADEPAFGLRGWVRRDGSLSGEHLIYVGTYYHPGVTYFPRATIPFRRLSPGGFYGDVYACYFGEKCSPFDAYGATIPDQILRATNASLPVRFYDYGGRDMTITINHKLIAAYLAKVDSVSAELRRVY